MWDSVPFTTPGCKSKTWIPPTKNDSNLKCSRLSQEIGICTIHICKTKTRSRSCPFYICISQFEVHNCTRRHSKENQDCQNQGANHRTVSGTLWMNTQISMWAIPHPYRSICYTKANTLQTHTSASYRNLQAKDWWDAQSWCDQTCSWSKSIDQ